METRLSREGVSRRFTKKIEGRQAMEIEQICKVRLKCGLTLAQRVAAGHYDYVDKEVVEDNFPTNSKVGKGELELDIGLFRPTTPRIWFREVVEFFGRRVDVVAGCIEELLALGEQYPKLQQKGSPIVAVGSIWAKRHEKIATEIVPHSPFLFDISGRRLSICPASYWGPESLFIAVKKSI